MCLSSCRSGIEVDQTFTTEVYLTRGMPEISRTWDLPDYLQACNILEEIKVAGHHSLPMKNSRKSGAYFAHMINPANVGFSMNDSIKLGERANRLFAFILPSRRLITIYPDLQTTEQFYHHELVELYRFGLMIAENLLELGNQINDSGEDANTQMQMGFPSIQDLYVSMIMLMIDNQIRRSVFYEQDRIAMSHVLFHSLRSYMDSLEPSSQVNILEEVRLTLNESRSKEIKRIYIDLIDLLGAG
jgi:hypothetical protein